MGRSLGGWKSSERKKEEREVLSPSEYWFEWYGHGVRPQNDRRGNPGRHGSIPRGDGHNSDPGSAAGRAPGSSGFALGSLEEPTGRTTPARVPSKAQWIPPSNLDGWRTEGGLEYRELFPESTDDREGGFQTKGEDFLFGSQDQTATEIRCRSKRLPEPPSPPLLSRARLHLRRITD